MHDIHVPVSVEGLQEKAREPVAPHNCKFKASSRWVKGFFKHHTLTLRAKTSLSQTLPAQLEDKFASFFVQVEKKRKMDRYPLSLRGNMIETPMYFDIVPNKMIYNVGARKVCVRMTGAAKRHVTVVLTVMADGKMLPPVVIFRGKGS